MVSINDILAMYEGKEELLYSNSDNPYESIYIKAKIEDGQLTITDSECDHSPDGGWSHRTLEFDKANTEKVFSMLVERNSNPFKALKIMMSYKNRTKIFRDKCDQRGIKYKSMVSF